MCIIKHLRMLCLLILSMIGSSFIHRSHTVLYNVNTVLVPSFPTYSTCIIYTVFVHTFIPFTNKLQMMVKLLSVSPAEPSPVQWKLNQTESAVHPLSLLGVLRANLHNHRLLLCSVTSPKTKMRHAHFWTVLLSVYYSKTKRRKIQL